MCPVVRISDDIDKWLRSFDCNFRNALQKVKNTYEQNKKISNKDIISKLEDLEQQIEALKRY